MGIELMFQILVVIVVITVSAFIALLIKTKVKNNAMYKQLADGYLPPDNTQEIIKKRKQMIKDFGDNTLSSKTILYHLNKKMLGLSDYDDPKNNLTNKKAD